MEKKQLTSEQKSKLRKLYGKVAMNAFLNGAKLALLIFFSNLFIVVVDHFLVKNQGFVFCSVAFSAFLIFRSYRISSSKSYDIFEEEYNKILKS